MSHSMCPYTFIGWIKEIGLQPELNVYTEVFICEVVEGRGMIIPQRLRAISLRGSGGVYGECSGEISEVGLGSRELKRGAMEGCSEGVRFQVHP